MAKGRKRTAIGSEVAKRYNTSKAYHKKWLEKGFGKWTKRDKLHAIATAYEGASTKSAIMGSMKSMEKYQRVMKVLNKNSKRRGGAFELTNPNPHGYYGLGMSTSSKAIKKHKKIKKELGF